MAPSQPVKREGIGGERRQHAGAEQNEQKVEHGKVSILGALQCAFRPSVFHLESDGAA